MSNAENLARIALAITADASLNLTGTTTPPLDDNSKKLMTTEAMMLAFTSASKRVTNSNAGRQKLPGGLVLQWGTIVFGATAAGSTYTTPQDYPEAFPTGTLFACVQPITNQPSQNLSTCDQGSQTRLNIYTYTGSSYGVGVLSVRWFAIGY